MKTAIISDIQHFCVSDGDGIRTTVFFKGCNLRCKWCHNVECISEMPQKLRYVIGAKEKIVDCGKTVTVEEVFQELLEDKRFYENSGGGVTFSGGEPLLQSEFLAVLMQRVKEHGIHCIVDTAGDVPFAAFARVIPYTDTFFFDIKAANSEDFLKYTCGNFENVLSNLRKLVAQNVDVVIRIPVIPNHNYSKEYMQKTCDLLREIGVKRVQLLPFNRLGSAKYEALGKLYLYKNFETMQKSDLTELLEICAQYFDAKIDG